MLEMSDRDAGASDTMRQLSGRIKQICQSEVQTRGPQARATRTCRRQLITHLPQSSCRTAKRPRDWQLDLCHTISNHIHERRPALRPCRLTTLGRQPLPVPQQQRPLRLLLRSPAIFPARPGSHRASHFLQSKGPRDTSRKEALVMQSPSATAGRRAMPRLPPLHP